MHTTAGAAFALQERAPGRLLHLHGRLDVSAATDARLALAAAVDAGQGDLVLDLTSLEAVDATGLGVLVGAHRRAFRQGRTLVLHESATIGIAEAGVGAAESLLLVVGPEGGIDDGELAGLTAAGALTVRLGPTVLRTSTAAAVALAYSDLPRLTAGPIT